MKGIILAGGTGSRLYPSTLATSKQLLPIYDKPLIYYPLSVLMLADIREILIITTPQDQVSFQRLLGDGSFCGITLSYAVQEKPRGLAEAFTIGEDFLAGEDVCLALGDNIFFGQFFTKLLFQAKEKLKEKEAVVFAYQTKTPEQFGVVEFDEKGNVLTLEEKPQSPKSSYAVPGLYFYQNSVVEKAKNCPLSPRGELEITSLNQEYLSEEKLGVVTMGRGMAWLDTGSPRNMMKASNFVQSIQDLQGFYVACLEEIGFSSGWISEEEMKQRCKELQGTEYGSYLEGLIK